MKKMIMLVVCLMIVGMQSVKAQAAIAALHHEGNVSIYSSVDVAIDNSVDGDTIYLSEGMFAEFTINKAIAVIGSGMKTVVAKDINISSSNVMICNISIVRDIDFQNGVYCNDIKIRQCKIAGDLNLQDIDNVEVLMCHIQGKIASSINWTRLITFVNSKIYEVPQGGKTFGSITFVNCNINKITQNYSYSDRNSYINCIIGSLMQGSFKNCLYAIEYDDSEGGCERVDCYTGVGFTLDGNLECSLTDEELLAGGYIGTDDTVVGITGGPTPFTLASPVLRITSHNIEVDNENRKLKVNLTLGIEE